MYLMVGIPRHVRVLRKTESLEILFGYMCCIDVNVLCALPAMCLFVWEEVFIPLSMRLTPRNLFFQVVSNLMTGILVSGWPADTQDPHPRHEDFAYVHVLFI